MGENHAHVPRIVWAPLDLSVFEGLFKDLVYRIHVLAACPLRFGRVQFKSKKRSMVSKSLPPKESQGPNS